MQNFNIKDIESELVKILDNFPARKLALWEMWLLDCASNILIKQKDIWQAKKDGAWQLLEPVYYLLFGHFDLWPDSYHPDYVNWEDVTCRDDEKLALAGEMWRRSDGTPAMCARHAYYSPSERRNYILADLPRIVDSVGILPKLGKKETQRECIVEAKEVAGKIFNTKGIISYDDTIGPPLPRELIHEVCKTLLYYNMDMIKNICQAKHLSWDRYPWENND